MSPLVGVSFAWVCVELSLAAWFVLLGARKAGPELGVFGFLSASVMAATLSGALQCALGARHAALWEALRAAASFGFAACAFDLALRFTGLRQRALRLVQASYGLAALHLVLCAAGLTFESQRVQRTVQLPLGPLTYDEASLSLLGFVLAGPYAALLLASLVLFALAAWRARRGLWGVAISFALVVVASAHDAVTSLVRLTSVYLFEHAAFLFVFATSYALLTQMTERIFAGRAELARTEARLQSVRESLARREHLAAVGELSAIVAHEIRNPLGAIANATSSLKRSDVAAGDRALLLSIIEEECDRMNRIVTDLLTLAKPLNLQRKPTDLRDLLARSLAPARREHTHVDLRVAPDAEEVIHCDAHLLRQALENVVDNAVQAMGRGGNLSVVVTRGARNGLPGREIAVIDEGEGMNTEVRANARKAFFTTRSNGTGLGLAIVDRIVTAHQGLIEIESSRGQGTTVRLFVPDGRESDPGPPPASSSRPPPKP